MAIKLYFGTPGCGKTTMIAMMVYKAVHSKKYANVYANVDLKIPGYTRVYSNDIGNFRLHDGILFIDEAAYEYNNRDYKTFDKRLVKFFMMHRHFRLTVCMWSQFPDSVDKKIRVITDECFMVYRSRWLGKWQTNWYKIPYGIVIPQDGDKLGEIIQGYRQPPWPIKLFCGRMWRPRWYKYFDSYEEYPLPELPAGRVYGEIVMESYQVPEVLPVDLRLEDPSSSSSAL